MLFRIYLTTQLLCCTSSKKFLLLFLYIRTFLVDFPENIECSLRAPAESLDGGTKEIYQLSTDGNGGGLFDDSPPTNLWESKSKSMGSRSAIKFSIR
jgi:hypothetical protein